jgi:predicted  nucleic acid-binding Zn-ribbon protein
VTVDDNAVVPADAEAIGPDPLQLLLEVQAHDLALDRLAYRHRELAERARLKELDGRRADLDRRLTDVEVRQTQLAKEQQQLEEHVEALLSRISVIEERLRAGAAGSFRDQQAMAVETESLDRQRRGTEDREIEIMEQLEPVESELTAVRTELVQIDAERAELSAAIERAESSIQVERRAVLDERAPLAASLPDALASSYERLRSKLGGIGAAKLVDGTCDGCHLKLPNRERDLIVHAPAGTIFYCDQCGRILVP